ncbi:hypothetical protein [Nostoc sp. PA-18-2419]
MSWSSPIIGLVQPAVGIALLINSEVIIN